MLDRCGLIVGVGQLWFDPWCWAVVSFLVLDSCGLTHGVGHLFHSWCWTVKG